MADHFAAGCGTDASGVASSGGGWGFRIAGFGVALGLRCFADASCFFAGAGVAEGKGTGVFVFPILGPTDSAGARPTALDTCLWSSSSPAYFVAAVFRKNRSHTLPPTSAMRSPHIVKMSAVCDLPAGAGADFAAGFAAAA